MKNNHISGSFKTIFSGLLFATLLTVYPARAAEPQSVTIEIKADVAYLDDYNKDGCFLETIGQSPKDNNLAYACREYTWQILNPTDQPAEYIEISDSFDQSLRDLSTSQTLAKIIKIKAVEQNGIEPTGFENGVFTAYAASVPAHGSAAIRIRTQILYEPKQQ